MFNHGRIRKLAKEIADKAKDTEFFTSLAMQDFLATIVNGVAKRFSRPVRIRLINNGEDGAPLAFTTGDEATINVGNSMINSLTRIDRFRAIIGHVIHETGHILFTDFVLGRSVGERFMESGKFNIKPNEEELYKEYCDVIDDIASNHEKNFSSIVNALYKIFDSIKQSCEDGYVDGRIISEIPGYGKDRIFCRNCLFNTSVEVKDKDNLNSFLNLIYYEAKYGKLKGEITDKALVENFELVKPMISASITMRNSSKRMSYMIDIFLIAFDKYVKNDLSEILDIMDDISSSFGSSSCDDSSSGSDDEGSSGKEGSESDGKSSGSKSSGDDSSDGSDDKGSSSKKGSGSDGKSSGSKSSGDDSSDGSDDKGSSDKEGSESDDKSSGSKSSGDDSAEDSDDKGSSGKDGSESDGKSSGDGSSDGSDDKGPSGKEGSESDDKSSGSKSSGDDSADGSDDKGSSGKDGSESDGKASFSPLTKEEVEEALKALASKLQEDVESSGSESDKESKPDGDTSSVDDGKGDTEAKTEDSSSSDLEVEASRNATLSHLLIDYGNDCVGKLIESEIEVKIKADLESTDQTSYSRIKSIIHRATLTDAQENLTTYENEYRESLLPVSKHIAKDLIPLFKDMQECSTNKGLYAGRRFDAGSAYRLDGRKMSNKKAPVDEPDIAICMLVDESGSTYGDTIDAERKTAYVVYDFCKRLNIPIAIYGHTESFEDPTGIIISYAEFDSVDGNDEKRIFGMCARENNRDGFAIRYGIKRLADRPEQIKLLMILSDGAPCAYDYGGATAVNDMREAVRGAVKNGMIVMAAGLGYYRDQIEKIYTDPDKPSFSAKYIDITDLNKMPRQFIKIIEKRLNAR